MDNKQITNIKDYLKIINNKIDNIEKENKGLIDFCIEEVIDRILLYLNADKLSSKLERIIAKIVNTGLKKSLNELKSELAVESAISSISDNGQSISFSNEVTRYFSTVSDEELFTGFSSLLQRYRRIKVVYPKHNEKTDS